MLHSDLAVVPMLIPDDGMKEFCGLQPTCLNIKHCRPAHASKPRQQPRSAQHTAFDESGEVGQGTGSPTPSSTRPSWAGRCAVSQQGEPQALSPPSSGLAVFRTARFMGFRSDTQRPDAHDACRTSVHIFFGANACERSTPGFPAVVLGAYCKLALSRPPLVAAWCEAQLRTHITHSLLTLTLSTGSDWTLECCRDF